MNLFLYYFVKWFKLENSFVVNERMVDSIYGLKKIRVRRIVMIFGINVKVCFWIWVVVWNMLMIKLISKVIVNNGLLIISVMYMVFFVIEIINFEFMFSIYFKSFEVKIL